jgi:hypothetical protein
MMNVRLAVLHGLPQAAPPSPFAAGPPRACACSGFLLPIRRPAQLAQLAAGLVGAVPGHARSRVTSMTFNRAFTFALLTLVAL